jgi:hypothetical protein
MQARTSPHLRDYWRSVSQQSVSEVATPWKTRKDLNAFENATELNHLIAAVTLAVVVTAEQPDPIHDISVKQQNGC